jgi:hypothetical protein
MNFDRDKLDRIREQLHDVRTAISSAQERMREKRSEARRLVDDACAVQVRSTWQEVLDLTDDELKSQGIRKELIERARLAMRSAEQTRIGMEQKSYQYRTLAALVHRLNHFAAEADGHYIAGHQS